MQALVLLTLFFLLHGISFAQTIVQPVSKPFDRIAPQEKKDVNNKISQKIFENPLRKQGADPYAYKHTDGTYYYTSTTGNSITLAASSTITGIKKASLKTVWLPPEKGPNSRDIWAPEIQYIDEKWYLYFTASDGDNKNRRMFVLENITRDPLEQKWHDKGKICDATDAWAIDGTVFENNGTLFFVWSGWEGNTMIRQNIYIAKMSNPWTISSNRVELSRPDFEWEKVRKNKNMPMVNEGPAVLKRNNKIFIIYSASHFTTDDYCLGMLTADINSDMLNSHSWKKSDKPVFSKSIENAVYGPGHCSFISSPDVKEDWIVYHAYSQPQSVQNRTRSARMQKFSWNKDGSPCFGIPISLSAILNSPSGE